MSTLSARGPKLVLVAPLLFYADGYKFPDVYHLTRFLSPDAIIALEDGSEVIVVANSLEEGRVRKQSRATTVFNIDAFGAKDDAFGFFHAGTGGRAEADAQQAGVGVGKDFGADAGEQEVDECA